MACAHAPPVPGEQNISGDFVKGILRLTICHCDMCTFSKDRHSYLTTQCPGCRSRLGYMAARLCVPTVLGVCGVWSCGGSPCVAVNKRKPRGPTPDRYRTRDEQVISKCANVRYQDGVIHAKHRVCADDAVAGIMCVMERVCTLVCMMCARWCLNMRATVYDV